MHRVVCDVCDHTGLENLFLPTEIESIQTSATTQAMSGADCRGQSILSAGCDRYGNLRTINGAQRGADARSRR